MRKTNTKNLFIVLSMTLLFLAVSMPEALAADKIGWVGPVYTELAESLTRGFKEYYKKTYDKDVDITFVNPGGWPVCLDKVRLWGGKPDADIFLGAGAPAHEIAKKRGAYCSLPTKRLGQSTGEMGRHES